jgi:DNA-directed RNA polymerase subunit M
MKFCPKCGALLLPKKEAKGSVLACPSCRYVDKKSDAQLKVATQVNRDRDVPIITEEDTSLPIVEAKCEKCDNDKAYYWMVQTRAGDEPETRFYKCTSCKNTWREYD